MPSLASPSPGFPKLVSHVLQAELSALQKAINDVKNLSTDTQKGPLDLLKNDIVQFTARVEMYKPMFGANSAPNMSHQQLKPTPDRRQLSPSARIDSRVDQVMPKRAISPNPTSATRPTSPKLKLENNKVTVVNYLSLLIFMTRVSACAVSVSHILTCCR